MTSSTPENIRHHAAGHVASAILLSVSGHEAAAKLIMSHVVAYVSHPLVSAPPKLLTLTATAAESPKDNVVDMRLLEEWFVHPLNTVIENSTISSIT